MLDKTSLFQGLLLVHRDPKPTPPRLPGISSSLLSAPGPRLDRESSPALQRRA